MTIWFTSDTHFGHEKFLTYTDGAGHPTRPFKTIDEMDETIIARWNAVVMPTDKVYHLGDVFFGDRERLPALLDRLNGRKRLCIGNHDLRGSVDARLLGGFEKVLFWRMFKDEGFICSHVPLRHDQFERKFRLNVHGHIHADPDPSPHHLNVSVERTDYTPVSMEAIRQVIRERDLPVPLALRT